MGPGGGEGTYHRHNRNEKIQWFLPNEAWELMVQEKRKIWMEIDEETRISETDLSYLYSIRGTERVEVMV